MKIGSLFTGYGGLDMAVEAAFDATTAWVSDIDKGSCKILAHRYPDVPNLGDITAIDWSRVEPVDIITGGSPCQDLSHAGRRAGMTEGTRSNLWVAMREAIAQIRPTYVIWENVRGAYSACAESEADRSLGPCPRCLDAGSGASHAPNLRALGRVLGDLSDLGYDTEWRGLRAADVGAPHGRFRAFVVARNTQGHDKRNDTVEGGGRKGGDELATRSSGRTAAHSSSNGRHQGRPESTRLFGRPDAAERGLLPTPTTRDPKGHNQRRDESCLSGALLKTPTTQLAVNGGAQHPDRRRAGGHGPTLADEVEHLLPTPVVTDAAGTRNATANRSNPDSAHHGGTTLTDALLPTPMVGSSSPAAHGQISGDFRARMDEALSRFGQYAQAISRWEQATGTVAPNPTEPTGRGGAHRLSARFTEWMMGLPAGWITDVPEVTRNEALKACGNGVVPQQAYAAVVDGLRAFADDVAA